jgi:hypothetical protein
MRKLAILLALAASAGLLGCKKDDSTQPPPVTPTGAPGAPSGAYGQPPPGYAQQPPPPGHAQQPPPPGYAPQPAPGGAMTPPNGPAPAGGMAVPGPAAFTCSNDTACGLAHCNTQYGKCAFPCVNADVDCIQGAACLAGFCVPKPPGQ